MLAQRIKELRKARKMTQRQLADILFIDCSAVTKWETRNANPDNQNLKRLAELFNVSVDYLLGRTDDPLTSSNSPLISHIQSVPTENTVHITWRNGTQKKYFLSDEQVNLVEGVVKQMTPTSTYGEIAYENKNPLSYGAVAAEGGKENRPPKKKPKTT